MPNHHSDILNLAKKHIVQTPFELSLDSFQLHAIFTVSSKVHRFDSGSLFFYVQEGTVELDGENSHVRVGARHYLSRKAPFSVKLHPNTFLVFVHTPAEHKVLDTVGGPIEEVGRLRYIDNCSDTLLLAPVLLGEPCLNLLHFPPQTNQTSHYHPSFRFGIITRGAGVCHQENKASTQLNTGDVFVIPKNIMHSFSTETESMDVIAFHPDSDWGPTNSNHPMINRTWVNGKKI